MLLMTVITIVSLLCLEVTKIYSRNQWYLFVYGL